MKLDADTWKSFRDPQKGVDTWETYLCMAAEICKIHKDRGTNTWETCEGWLSLFIIGYI